MTNADDMDAFIRSTARRRRPKLEDLERTPQPTATTNDRRGIRARLEAEWAAQTEGKANG